MDKDSLFYDDVYKQGGHNQMYHKHYKQSIYYPIWTKTIDLLDETANAEIIDIGCGVGQFANLLFDHGFLQYKGLDFSTEAIAVAKEVNPTFEEKFVVDNAYTTNVFSEPYNVVILFEVLEHLAGDIEVIDKIRTGTNVLLSVPNFDSVSHVRYFKSEQEIRERYSKLLDIKNIHTFKISAQNKIFLCECMKK
ncbi:methyltransferase domain-containing protein [Priestia filamentosa]|uniref:class I SAM-dependent methyltransferase n=1 Tax=Priestia filamentosa TaxID=1402861 RepID=UPI00397C6FC1